MIERTRARQGHTLSLSLSNSKGYVESALSPVCLSPLSRDPRPDPRVSFLLFCFKRVYSR